ncbi:hypothetical protein [Catellatospora bangladeshensis]|uniref:Uncharacterized protein n=1 Tax=Catellatospora bangladeshensis TaxID=310355 RepID=A0A8J3JLZ2_9ACTN|nr:hypothetical protein [Catellatospora bangladeshensis]GIF84929.1 hypothetical protein Cba03nite_62780 [Catellatospora bangladeshensis]
MTEAPPTINEAAAAILGELAPEELALLDPVAAGFFGSDSGRDRAVRTALEGRSGDDPVGFDLAGGAGLLAAFLLTVLNGVACDLLTAGVSGQARGWWERRRLRKRLSGAVAPQGSDTPLPQLSSTDAAEIGRLALQLALDSKVEPERAQRVANLITAALTGPAR